MVYAPTRISTWLDGMKLTPRRGVVAAIFNNVGHLQAQAQLAGHSPASVRPAESSPGRSHSGAVAISMVAFCGACGLLWRASALPRHWRYRVWVAVGGEGNAISRLLADTTLGVYLIHPLVLMVWAELGPAVVPNWIVVYSVSMGLVTRAAGFSTAEGSDSVMLGTLEYPRLGRSLVSQQLLHIIQGYSGHFTNARSV